MNPKEINQLIQNQTENFFKEKGFKYSKKDMDYVQSFESANIRYGFSYVERKPQYYYQISLFIRLVDVEQAYAEARNSTILGETYVFPMSYFLDKTNYIDKNPKYIIENIQDVQGFSDLLIKNYSQYVEDFIPFITHPQNMLDFLLGEIEAGKQYAIDDKVFMRSLILMKKLGDKNIHEKLREFKEKLSHYREDIREQYYKQMDYVVQSNS